MELIMFGIGSLVFIYYLSWYMVVMMMVLLMVLIILKIMGSLEGWMYVWLGMGGDMLSLLMMGLSLWICLVSMMVGEVWKDDFHKSLIIVILMSLMMSFFFWMLLFFMFFLNLC